MKITAVTTCMGRLEHLEMTLPLMLEEFDHVIMVDWSCPDNSGDWAKKQGAEVVKRNGEKYWNASKARNLGARNVKNRSLCFIDADTMVMPGISDEIADLLDLRSMVLAARRPNEKDITDLGGFIALDIGQFWGVGGWNESLEGYGLEDNYLRAQLVLERGMTAKRLRASSLGAIRHSNELRQRHVKDSLEINSKKNYSLVQSYLKSHGVTDWVNDPRTSNIAFRL